VPPRLDIPDAPCAPAIPAPIPMFSSGKRHWLVTVPPRPQTWNGCVWRIVWPSGIRMAADMFGVFPR
jgi:hypothetical protein